MKCFRKVIVLVGLLVLGKTLIAQGCSDAGVCSIDAFNLNQKDDSGEMMVDFSYSQTMELGEQSVLYSNAVIGVAFPINQHAKLGITIPYRVAYFQKSLYSGLSDLTLSYSRRLTHHFDGVVGVKIPPNKADERNQDGEALPMALQTSLGTYDLLFSLSYSTGNWKFSSGWQHPFRGNDNSFVSREAFSDFSTSNRLVRGDDVMVRADWNKSRPKGHWQVSALGVYRVVADMIHAGEAVPDSKGLTINLFGAWSHSVPNGNVLKYALAVPLLVREARVDGLTRSAIFAFTWSGAFTKR